MAQCVRLLSLTFIALYIFLHCEISHAQNELANKPTLKVDREKEGLILLDLPKVRMELSPFVVFVRPSGPDFEIIARGKVETIQDNKILVTLDRSAIIKYPLKGDLAVPLGTPRDWPPDSDPKVMTPPMETEELEPPGDPGFFQIDSGVLSGAVETTSSDGTSNEYKDIPKYQPTFFHFLWYFEFLWQLGIEYESASGVFPTSTYYRNFGPTTEKKNTFTLNYRFRRKWFKEKLRPAIRFMTTTSEFATLNTDEALISSQSSAMGMGARLSYEFDSQVWKPKKGSGLRFQQVVLGLNYYPFVNVADTGSIKRGTSSGGSNILEYKLSCSTLMYLKWFPWIKRYVFEFGYSETIAHYKFSGATASETLGFYTIPENTSSTEQQKWFFVTLGVRFEDVVGAFFKPR
jgi:hypothetical protein